MCLHFDFVTLRDQAVQMQSMKIVRHSRKFHKIAHKILIYGQI